MFNKDNDPKGTSSGMPSIIGVDLKVIGDLHCTGDLQVEGKVEGDIQSKSVTIGEGANVSGAIRAESVQVSGAVKGQIEATSVILDKTAKVSGDVVHQTLTMEAGAELEGQCSRLAQEKKAAPETRAPDLKSVPREASTAGGSAGNGTPANPAAS